MNVQELINNTGWEVLDPGDHLQDEITGTACCDLLSVAMGSIPEGSAWVTVMANLNTLAVASLTEAACVILAYGTAAPEDMLTKASATGITLLRSKEPSFETALQVHDLLAQGSADAQN